MTQIAVVALIGGGVAGVQRSKLRELQKTLVHQDRSAAPAEVDLGTDPFVLYLRSFVRDEDDYQLNSGFDLSLTPDDPEITLDKAFAGVMPVLAVGQPGETLPPLGAHRLYYDDDEWQEAVSLMIEHASLIVLRPGPSRAILWEVEHIVSMGHLQKLVLYAPVNSHTAREDYEEFRGKVSPFIPQALPPGNRISGRGVAFGADGAPVLTRSPVSALRGWFAHLSEADRLYNELVPLLNWRAGESAYPLRTSPSAGRQVAYLMLGCFALFALFCVVYGLLQSTS
jgi:hypothetical protein